MPLLKSKTPEAFKSNLKTELNTGKPMKQSLAIAYAMKRKAKKMADGGGVEGQGETLGSRIGYPGAPKHPKMMSAGGELESGYLSMPEENEKDNEAADEEEEKHLNQMLALGGAVVDRIMEKHHNKTNMMSEGGRVANSDHLEDIAGFKPAEYDDLALRDDLEFHDTGANSGDEIGNAREDHDREDIVSRIMKSRAKKDRLPQVR